MEHNRLGSENKRPLDSNVHTSGTEVDANLLLIFKGLTLNMVTLYYTQIKISYYIICGTWKSKVLRHSRKLNIKDTFNEILLTARTLQAEQINSKQNDRRFTRNTVNLAWKVV